MDPNKCWDDLLTAVTENDVEEAKALEWALRAWMNNGGFGPEEWDRELVENFLLFVRMEWIPKASGAIL